MVLSGFSTIQSDSSKLVGATWAGSVTTRQTRVGDVPTVALPRSRTIQPDLDSNCRVRGHSVSPPLTLRLDFSKPGLTGRHFNYKRTSWNVNRLCWSRNGKDGGKKKKKKSTIGTQSQAGLFGFFFLSTGAKHHRHHAGAHIIIATLLYLPQRGPFGL